MNLRQLRFAHAVASTGSFTAAAAECCVTQPTLSNGIAQLENELGERLFVRTTRKVALTPFGVHVLPYINEVLSAQASLLQQTQAFLRPAKRLIRIGTSPLVSANLLGLMIEPFRLSNPDVDLVLREMNMSDLYRMLDDGLLDFVFGVADVQKGPVTATFLYEEPLLFIPRGAVWSNGPLPRSVQLKDIAEETYVMVPDACGLSRATRALFRSQRRKLREYSGEAMSYQVLEEWAALGIGAAILPKSKVTSSAHASFPIADKSGRAVTIGFEAIWSRNGSQSSHLLEFTDHLRKVVPTIVAGLQQANIRPRRSHPEPRRRG
ncbi:MAG: hypothetical protein RJA99_1464 [Pseudomonadota bacterium]|jgi:DNA-binding transcriptional LysR family regulator